ncbi:MAG: glycosyltransferase family protein [Candidatus Staskawiczbacteria bacterium]|nr:glycosyltransferase family protein [Candidatus Staskawiczbacteria bacterium]
MINNKKIAVIVEARMTSTRLPGKVLMPVLGEPCLYRMIERLRKSKHSDDIIVATTVNKTDDCIVELCEKIGCRYYRGSEDDVLRRVLEAAKLHKADLIVEIPGDNICIDWRHVDYTIKDFFSDQHDFASNCIERSFPMGFDVKIFPTSVLEEVERTTKNPKDREHVSLYIYMHPEKYRLKNWKAGGKMFWPELQITLDTQEDYELISKIYENLYSKNTDFSAEDVVDLLRENPELMKINKHIIRKNPFINYVK